MPCSAQDVAAAKPQSAPVLRRLAGARQRPGILPKDAGAGGWQNVRGNVICRREILMETAHGAARPASAGGAAMLTQQSLSQEFLVLGGGVRLAQ